MFVFLDKYLYLCTFIVIIISCIIVKVVNFKPFLVRHSRKIAWVLCFIQLETFIQIVISKSLSGGWFHILLTDLCPLLAFCSILIFAIHRNSVYKMFMPWFIIASTLTILVGGTNFVVEGAEPAINSYIRHITLLIQGLFLFIWVNSYSKKDYYRVVVFPALALVWIFFIAGIPWMVTKNPAWGVFSTAMLPPALQGIEITYGNNITETYGSYVFLGDFPMPYPIPTILFYLFAVGMAYLVVFTKNNMSSIWNKLKTKFELRQNSLLKK